METSVSTYSCPHCAEQIQRQALRCRFCKRNVTWNLLLVRRPLPGSLPSAIRELYERYGKKSFPSYGALRKTMEETDGAVLWGLTREDAEGASSILASHGGEARIELNQDEFESPPEPAHKKRPAFQFLIAALTLSILAAVYFAKQQAKEPPSVVRPVVRITPSNPSFSEAPAPSPEVKKEEEKNLPTQEVQLHLRTLVKATATLSGNGVTGSAFFIAPAGYLITNHHVIEAMHTIAVQTSDGKSRPGEVIRDDPRLDLALVKAEGGPYPTLGLGDATSLEQGETVWTIGAPHGLSFTVTRGVVSFVGRKISGKAYIQADVAINPGNSGGPMINEHGFVVGINNFIISNAVGLNFAIPINYVYMGNDPIVRDFIPTSPDNAIMATWRSWSQEGGSASAETANAPALTGNDSSNAEVTRLFRDANALKGRFEQDKTQRESNIARIQSQLTEAQTRYQADTESISEEATRGKRVKKLTQDLLQEQLALENATLEYCVRQEAVLNQIQGAAQSDDNVISQATSQITQLQQLRTATQNLKEKTTADLQSAPDVVY